MTFVGKVLIVVNVVMTVCVASFAGGVYAFQTNWRTKYNKEVEARKLTEKQTDESDAIAKAAKAAVDRQLTDAKAESIRYKVQVDALTSEVAGLKEANKNITVQRDIGSETQKLLTDDNAAKLKIVEQQRKFLADLHKKIDALTSAIAKLEDEKYGLLVERRQINRRHQALLEEVIKYKILLVKNDVDPDGIKNIALGEVPTKPAEGLVIETRNNTRSRTELVQISVGKDDGVAEGQVLTVYRLTGKGKYLGRIEIVSVTADTAVGMVIAKAKNGKIEKGDNVSAKL